MFLLDPFLLIPLLLMCPQLTLPIPQPPTTSSPEVDGLDDNEDNNDAYIKGKNFNLDSSEVYGIFLNAKKQPEKLNTMPPVKPAGGSIFVYDLGSCTAQHDLGSCTAQQQGVPNR